MNANEIKEKIERLEKWLYWEEYADFINWPKYYEVKHEIAELKRELEKLGE